MTHDEFARMKVGAAELKSLVEQSVRGDMRMMGLAVSTGLQVVNYVAHLEAKTDWQHYHSALSQCAELLDNMKDGDLITDTPKFLSEKLEQTSRTATPSAQRTNNEVSRDEVLEEAARILDAVNNHDNPMTAGDCADAIRALKGTATPAPAPAGGDAWISVDERLPEQDVAVALLDENRWMNTGSSEFSINWHGAGYLCEFGQKYWAVFGEPRSVCLDAVTHWMPLPQAPTPPVSSGVLNNNKD